MKDNHWTAEEYREYQRTGREPIRNVAPTRCQPGKPRDVWGDLPVTREMADIVNAYKNPIPQEEIERRYAEAEARGEVMALDIRENPDGGVTMTMAGKVAPVTDIREAMGGKRTRKYGNEPTYIDGIRFDSKHEAMVYKDLMFRVKAGELKCVIRQVRFDLAWQERLQYVADFVTILPDMKVEVLDAKSEATRKNKVYVIKKKLMREVWGIEIKEV